MPEKLSLSRLIIKVASYLAFFTLLLTLILLTFSRLKLGSGGELRQIAGTDFLFSLLPGIAIFSLLFGLGGLLSLSGIDGKKGWAWFSSLGLALILILMFPLGTIFGLKLLLSLFDLEVRNWFYPSASKAWPHPSEETGAEGLESDSLESSKDPDSIRS